MTRNQLLTFRQHVINALATNTTIDKNGVLTIAIPAFDIMALNAVHDICCRELEFRAIDETLAEGGAS